MKYKRLALLVTKILLAVIVIVVLWFNIPLVFDVPLPFFPPTPPPPWVEFRFTPSMLKWDESPKVVVLEVGVTDYRYCDKENGNPQVQLWGDGRMVWLSAEDTVTREEHLTTRQMGDLLRRVVEEVFPSFPNTIPTSGCNYISINLVGWHRVDGKSVNLHYGLHRHSAWTSCQDNGAEPTIDATNCPQDIDDERFFAFYDEMVCGVRELDAARQE